MELGEHLRTTGTALKRWLIAASYDALAVGAMWLVGLLIIGVPWAPFWAILGGLCQFVPNIGMVMALMGPAVAAVFSGGPERLVYVLVLYAVIVVVDGLALQPYLMKRTTRVPIWASIVTPIAQGILIAFWGVLLAAPLLAVVYAYKARSRAVPTTQPPVAPGAGPVVQ